MADWLDLDPDPVHVRRERAKARELRKTQRRCNALNRIFIPEYKATTDYITASLEERERENFVILRMVKERLAKTSEGETKDVVRQ